MEALLSLDLDLGIKALDRESVKFSDLEIKDLIMKQESGDKLYEVVDRLTGATYALKEFNIQYNSSDRAEISREVEIIKKLDHPNLVKCHEMFYIVDRIYILLEHMDGGSLTAVDIKSERALGSVAYQVLSGLSYLHRNKISHGDIKPSNFFVNSVEQVKVLYLGKLLSKGLVVMSGIIDIHDEFSWDVWNVGLSILKLYKGSYWGLRGNGFEEINDSEEVFSSSHASVQKPSKELWRFLVCCMQTDLSKRWTSEQLACHPFVTQQSSVLNFMSEGTEEFRSFLGGEYRVEGVTLKRKTEGTVFIGGEQQISRKKYKYSVRGEARRKFQKVVLSIRFLSILKQSISQRRNDVKSSIDPTLTVPHGHFGHHSTLDYCGKCIQHCSLFLPDCEFEKAKLVQLWIAEECIKEEVTKRMEDVANLYFDTLVHQEVIIPSKFDNFYKHLKYKVNTSKSSTWFLTQGIYLRIDEGNLDEICGEALHLTWHCKRLDRTLLGALKIFKQLRTLLVLEDCDTSIKQLPNDIFLGLKLLKTLDLSRTHISELPGSIGTVKSLRFLDISETPIKRLPESTDRLYLLQTLRLRGCIGLSALPRGMRSLVNLRHLDLDIVGQLKSMPKGMGNLTKLQTLQAFLVGKNDGCGIGELKNMNDITGPFCISRLENVANAEEAKQAALADKQHIDKLELRWHDHENDSSEDTAEILECLQPHFHLSELQITLFSGSKLPSWISNPSFTDLASITLYKCINCRMLPCIGELPSLKILHIVEMKNVRDINSFFCRTRGTQGFNAFPRLEKLTLDNMLNLEEWSGLEDGDFPCLHHISIRYCPKLSGLPYISHLNSLQHLEVSHCSQLISLSDGLLPGSLETLIIRSCPKLNERCLTDRGEDRFKIAHVKNIWMDFQKISLD